MATLPIETDIETILFEEITIGNYKDILQKKLSTILDSLVRAQIIAFEKILDNAQNPIEWLDDFEKAVTANQYDNEYKFQIVGGYLQGSSVTWFLQETNANAQQRIIRWALKNESKHSESLESKETEPKPEKITENKEEMTTAYIAKIPEFTGKNNDTSSQEWLDKVQKAEDANGWIAARMLKAILYFLQGTAGEWFENLEELFENWQAFKDAFLQQFTDKNTSITLRNHFHNIKQETSETVMTYLGRFNKLFRQIRQLETNEMLKF
ncbi:hypothetical protein G9A89_012785 [Geosiphon pyriformis]|nr:hypothetical protein G9A89_012785 [Geosiphon pyriformis]